MTTRCHRPGFPSITHALQGMAPDSAAWFCPYCRRHHREPLTAELAAFLQSAHVRRVYVFESVVDEELEAA